MNECVGNTFASVLAEMCAETAKFHITYLSRRASATSTTNGFSICILAGKYSFSSIANNYVALLTPAASTQSFQCTQVNFPLYLDVRPCGGGAEAQSSKLFTLQPRMR